MAALGKVLMRLAERLFLANRKNREWLDSIQPPNDHVARIDAEIKALLAKWPVTK